MKGILQVNSFRIRPVGKYYNSASVSYEIIIFPQFTGDFQDFINEVISPTICKSIWISVRQVGVSFIPRAIVGMSIDENKVVSRLNSHPIVTVPLWEGAPTSDRDKWTVDLINHLLNDLGELANLIMACQLDKSDEAVFKHS